MFSTVRTVGETLASMIPLQQPPKASPSFPPVEASNSIMVNVNPFVPEIPGSSGSLCVRRLREKRILAVPWRKVRQ